MIVDEQVLKLFEGVLSKTRAGKIPWQPTAEESTFLAAVGGQFTLFISAWRERVHAILQEGHAPLQRYALVLEDQAGGGLARITDGDEGIRAEDFRELYETARRKARNTDEKIDDVLRVLSSL